MIGEPVWVRKEDDVRLIEMRNFPPLQEDGFVICEEPVSEPIVTEPEPPKTNLITLYKEGQECQCALVQVAAMEAAGWSHTKGVSDAGHELEGRKLDQEHGSGGHGDEPGDEAVGVEQHEGKRRDRPNRRKRGNE